MIDNLIWDEISLEVVAAARVGMSVKDFEIQCRLAPSANGKSFFDRIRVAESLVRDKLVSVEDGYLKLAQNSIPESLFNNLLSGSEVAWKILDCIDPPKKLLQKLDQDLLNKIGLDGELAVIKKLKIELPQECTDRVRHISLIDDSAGFDIQAPSVRNTEEVALLEVKTSIRPGDAFTFYISKNEARIGRQNQNWFLIGVESFADDYRVFGYLSFNAFSDLLPVNQSNFGEWESAKIVVSKKIFFQGLP
jgi:hypothetical protein